MRNSRLRTTFGGFFLLVITILSGVVSAQSSAKAKFSLNDGDRVVFLGNSLFENDFQYGYLELMLTTRFPDKDFTVRNLGWSGDNVWGEARSTYTNPPTAYEHMIQHLTKAKPTVVFLAYGGVEAQNGAEGLPRFREGLGELIDKIDALGARTVMLSPIPVVSADTTLNLGQRNADLELYAMAISQAAKDRGKLFIDIYKPVLDVSKKASIIESGVHLNETGYYFLATVLENALGLKKDRDMFTLTVLDSRVDASANMKGAYVNKEGAGFRFTDRYLPLPFPKEHTWITDEAVVARVAGLKKKFYMLTADDVPVLVASAKEWDNGMEIRQGPDYRDSEELREMILRKNDLHFFQYRPMNETYITGFRAYEQGRHVKGLEEQNILISWLEGQIALKKKPKEVVYHLVPLK
jgi:lysophospholipase L1-like esterase